MKTWEVYKIALENPKAKFKRLSHGDIAFLNDKGQLVTNITEARVDYPIASVDQEWELVREPVDFMVAAKAFIKGKNISCEYTSSIDGSAQRECYKQAFNSKSGVMSIDSELTFYQIVNGKWYIEE